MKNSARYYQKGTLVTTQNTCYFCQAIMKHEFSPQIFEKYSNNSFMNIHPVVVKLFHVDRQDMIKQFCKRT